MKPDVSIRDLILTNEFSAIEVVESPPSKKRKRSKSSRKKKVIMPLIPENHVIHGNGDIETLAVGG